MIDIKQIIQEASIDAMHRNVKFIKNLLIDGMNMERIGSIVIFTADSPNSAQPIDTKTNDELIKALSDELQRCHYIHLPVTGSFGTNEENAVVAFNMRITPAKRINYDYQQSSFFFIHPNDTQDGFVAEYWEKGKTNAPVDNVRNPYIKKAETDLQHTDGAYILSSNHYTFHLNDSLFASVIKRIESGLEIVAKKYHIEDKDWLLDYLTNSIGLKKSTMRAYFNGEMVVERTKLNHKERSESLFPGHKYRMWVQTDYSPHKSPNLHIRSKEEGWELKVYINTCEIGEVINKGKRKSDNSNEFRDVVEDLKKWFKLQTTVPGQTGNNQETAYNKWIALNEE